MLWTSTKVVHQYIPGTIILEVPGLAPSRTHEDMDEEDDDDGSIEIRLCEHCDEPLTYIEQYDRWYCYECREYAPRD